MKKSILFFLPALFAINIYSQETEQELDVSIQSPSMKELVNRIWNRLPTGCFAPEYINREQGDEVCAGIALKHLKYIITTCDISDGMKEAIKTEFKIIKLIPVGKAAGAMLDIADMTAKALMAESPEQLQTDLETYAIGKFPLDQLAGKLKSLLPEGTGNDLLANLTKTFMKEVYKKAKEAILPSEQNYECQPESGACKDNILMTFIPLEEVEEGSRIIGYFNYSANGDCACALACSPGSPHPKLKDWSIHGSMALEITNAQVVERGFWFLKRNVLEITLSAGEPSFNVIANCDCSENDDSNISYDEEDKNYHFFAGAGFVNEDAFERFNLYGANISYTRKAGGNVGITGDAGLYFANQEMIKYRRVQVLAGPSLSIPSKNGKLTFLPHILAGISNTHAAYENNSFSNSNTFFSMSAGTDLKIKLNEKRGIGFRLGYNPVFPQGGMSHNIRLSAGIYL